MNMKKRKQIISYHYINDNYDIEALKRIDFKRLGNIRMMRVSIDTANRIVTVVIYGDQQERFLVAGLIRRFDPNWRLPTLEQLELINIDGSELVS